MIVLKGYRNFPENWRQQESERKSLKIIRHNNQEVVKTTFYVVLRYQTCLKVVGNQLEATGT